MSDAQRLAQDLEVGQAIVAFQTSMLGRFLYQRAHEDILQATQELKDMDPYRESAEATLRAMASAQLKIQIGERFITWLEAGISAANAAAVAIDQADDASVDAVG